MVFLSTLQVQLSETPSMLLYVNLLEYILIFIRGDGIDESPYRLYNLDVFEYEIDKTMALYQFYY